MTRHTAMRCVSWGLTHPIITSHKPFCSRTRELYPACPSLNRSAKSANEVYMTCWECDVTIAKKKVEETAFLQGKDTLPQCSH